MPEFMPRKYSEEGIGKPVDEENVVDAAHSPKDDGDAPGKNLLVCPSIHLSYIRCVSVGQF